MREDLAARAVEMADRIEEELRRLGWWDVPAPTPEAMRFERAFGADTMTFPQWVRFVLVPTVRRIVAEGGDLPGSSSVGTYAVRELDGMAEAEGLIHLLSTFDALFEDGDPIRDPDAPG